MNGFGPARYTGGLLEPPLGRLNRRLLLDHAQRLEREALALSVGWIGEQAESVLHAPFELALLGLRPGEHIPLGAGGRGCKQDGDDGQDRNAAEFH